MSAHIIRNILVDNLQALNRLQESLFLHASLGPFTRLSTPHFATLSKLNREIIPSHTKALSTLFQKYKVQPPLPFCGVHKPVLIGLLTHLSFAEKYSEEGLKKLFTSCSEGLNDSIRELNQNDLQQKQLRSFLISCRNQLDSHLPIFSQIKEHKDAVSKAIHWLL